jgi:putative FmdB family regulatory protein
MLTYEYLCEKCGAKFERRQRITDEKLSECPECGGPVRRLISGGGGIIIKGAGAGRSSRRESGCSLERVEKTCCGRDERCGEAPCGE